MCFLSIFLCVLVEAMDKIVYASVQITQEYYSILQYLIEYPW